MTVSVITSGLLRAMGSRGLSRQVMDDRVVVTARRARVILPVTALGLQVAMLVMRMPVLMANLR